MTSTTEFHRDGDGALCFETLIYQKYAVLGGHNSGLLFYERPAYIGDRHERDKLFYFCVNKRVLIL